MKSYMCTVGLLNLDSYENCVLSSLVRCHVFKQEGQINLEINGRF